MSKFKIFLEQGSFKKMIYFWTDIGKMCEEVECVFLLTLI